jgi:hypothetical protein
LAFFFAASQDESIEVHVVWSIYVGVLVVWCKRGVVQEGCGATGVWCHLVYNDW